MDRAGLRYRYKVMSSQMPRTFVEVEAASIEEAERHGIVMILIGPASGRAPTLP